MARTVRDAALLLQVLAGHDSRDPSSLRSATPDYSAGLGQSIQGLRIAWSPDLGYCPVDPQVLEATASAAQMFQEFGCVVEETDFSLDNPLPPSTTSSTLTTSPAGDICWKRALTPSPTTGAPS